MLRTMILPQCRQVQRLSIFHVSVPPVREASSSQVSFKEKLSKAVPPDLGKFMDRLLQQAGRSRNRSRRLDFDALASQYDELRRKEAEFHDLLALLEDGTQEEEMRRLAEADVEQVLADVKGLAAALSDSLLPAEVYDAENAVMEVVPGAGGLEACLFAEEVFNMYTSYMRDLGNEVRVTELARSSVGKQTKFASSSGIVKAAAVVKGDSVFRQLKYECGVHRVQRVPVTGTKNDRLQTSTCSVCVLPEPKSVGVKVDERDVKFEFMRASGAGGQVGLFDFMLPIPNID